MSTSAGAAASSIISDSELCLSIPDTFRIYRADGRGDCFFHACAQSLTVALGEKYTTEGLRLLCSDYMKELALPGFAGNWIFGIYRQRIISSKTVTKEAALKKAEELYNSRVKNIAFSAEDKQFLGLEPTSMWAEQEIDGRIICIRINHYLASKGSPLRIKIHSIESSDAVVTHQLIDEYEEVPVSEPHEIAQLYEDPSIVHIICKLGHWQPILLASAVLPREDILPDPLPDVGPSRFNWRELLVGLDF